MKNLFRLFGFFKKTQNAEDIKVVTDYLKKNENFKKAALDIHNKKETAKTSFFSAIDDLLEQEDGIKEKKQISDKSKENKKH